MAVEEVKKLGARHTGQGEGETISRLFGKLAVLLVKGNTALVNNRAPGNTTCELLILERHFVCFVC